MDYKNLGQQLRICVYAELKCGLISPSVFEILSLAKRLRGQLGYTVSVTLIGNGVRKVASSLLAHGVDEVWLADTPNVHDFAEDVLAEVVWALVRRMNPKIIMASSTTQARSVFPRLAAKLGADLCSDCLEIRIKGNDRKITSTRMAYGGRLLEEIMLPAEKPLLLLLRQKGHGVQVDRGSTRESKGRIIDVSDELSIPASRFEILEFAQVQRATDDLENARIIVGVGRGIKSGESIPLVVDFAKALGGTIGATRGVVDEGWLDASYQIGQTGLTVNPDVYIACGISGAGQHLAGISNCRTIVAINSDRNAPIFDVATYGIVGDLFEIIPEFMRRISARQAN